MLDSTTLAVEAPARGHGAPPASFRNRFLHMLGRDDPPEQTAASFALGVAISFTPFFGLHWAIALGLAFLLKLNKVDVLLGTLAVNPLTFGPVSALAFPLGRLLLRTRHQAVAHLPWHQLFTVSFWAQARPSMRAAALQWVTGMLALALLIGALTYVVVVNIIRDHRAKSGAAPAGTMPAPPPA